MPVSIMTGAVAVICLSCLIPVNASGRQEIFVRQPPCDQLWSLRYDGLAGLGVKLARVAELNGMAPMRARIARTPSQESSDAGQSYLQVEGGPLSIGIPNENLWWGPAVRYPLILSNTTPSFAHLFLGTTRPLSLGVATLKVWFVIGELSESEYFDDDASNDRPRLSGVTFSIQPKILPGPYFGVV
jgi:hypothetical protein